MRLGSEDSVNIKSKLLNLESNQTNSHTELINVKNHIDKANAKLDMVEAAKNTNIAAIQENTDKLTVALTELEEHKGILQNISTILDDFTSDSYTQLNNDNNPYIDTFSHIEASIDKEIKINKQQTAMIALLESTLTHINTTFESNIEKNLVKIEENIIDINILRENVTAQHILLNDQCTRTHTLKVELTFIKDAIQVLNDTIKHVNTNMCDQNEGFYERLIRGDNITTELQANSTQLALIDHSTRIHAIELELSDLEDYNKRIQQVEFETNITKNTLEDIKTRIEDVEHVGNLTQNSVQDIIGRLDNMTGKSMSAFSVGLESELITPKGDKVIYDHVIFDLNGDFNMSTGEFVAPIAGLYELNFHAVGYWYAELYLELYCNDRYIISAYGQVKDDRSYPVTGNAVVFELKNKDRCYIKARRLDNKLWGGPGDISTTFSGHLVAPDAR